MRRWRIAVHALDRTGPPVLALALLRRMRARGMDVDVVAFRGGEMLDQYLRVAPTHVAVEPHESWDHSDVDPRRRDRIRGRLSRLGPAEVTLLVSVSAGQVLDLVPGGSTVAAWVVERRDDLSWLAPPLDLQSRVQHWFAGSADTIQQLRGLLDDSSHVALVPEFIEGPCLEGIDLDRYRSSLGATEDELLVVGAGIGTPRKGPDLFVEAALQHHRTSRFPSRFVWIGGERDEFAGRVRAEAARLDVPNLRFVDAVTDVEPWFACADVFLHTARSDAFPLVCLHGAAAGTPVVGFGGTGGLEEMFDSSFLGVPYPDVAGLCTVIDELGDPSRRSDVALLQRTEVRRRYQGDGPADAMIDALRSVTPSIGAPK